MANMNETEDNRPEWMIELENRKRKPRLAHEAGAGSPCLSCKESCPGLDLHFWRKICKNCKCGRDEHDVVDDEFPQFDLLLGPSKRPKKKAIFLPLSIKKEPENVNAFDWVPPDVTTELATDYMKALPENKLPIQGSEGAALRKQQLQKQLPLHDMDHKACDKLSEEEKQQFEKYLENLKKYVGQGRVSKVIGARPFSRSLMTPANAADMQPMSPQRKPQGYSSTGESTNLRTPSSFITKTPGISPAQGSQKQQAWLAANMEAIHAQISENANSTNVRLGQYHPVLDNVSAAGQLASSESVSSNRHPAQQFANNSEISESQKSINSVFRNPENIQYIPDFGKVNYQTEYSRTGEQFEPGTNFESVTPINNPNIDSNVALSERSHLPHQQISSIENLPTSWNLSHGSKIQSGQYHGSNLPSSNAKEAHVEGENLGTLKHGIPVQNRILEDGTKELQLEGLRGTGMGQSMVDELRDIGRVMQNVSSSDNVPLTNAQLAEQMLSDALLPPSAVHANEIIGSTLDRNKLKYIQEKLSAKYSKDDPPSQQLLKSQRIDKIIPQYGQSIDDHKNSQVQNPILNKEANRAAIIAAMRNPSGIFADSQWSEKIGADYANPLGQSGQGKNRDLLVPFTGTPEEFANLPKANSNELNEKYPTIPMQGNQQGSTALPLDSTLELEDAERDKLSKSNQVLNRPTQYQYSDATLSSLDPLSVIHDQQQQSLNADHHPPLNLDKSRTRSSHTYDDDGLGGPGSTNHPTSHNPATADPTLQKNYSQGNSGIPNNEKNFGNPSPALNPEQLRAELSYQSVNSHLIHSESLGNPLFPEGIIDSPGLRQNPASVDQLRGALEELAVGPIQLQKCTQCKEEIHSGDVVVTAERAKDAIWHPGCFICSTCNELLVDLVYFYHKGKLYCGRDLATLLNIPRCFACDELIFVREYTVAEGHNYHIKHFCCWDCDMPLAGQQYISENDRPLCLPCYQKTYAKTCKTCNKVIAADQQGVAVKNLDFHANDDCFCCFTCKKSLLSGKMAIKEERPFCSKECITNFLSNKS